MGGRCDYVMQGEVSSPSFVTAQDAVLDSAEVDMQRKAALAEQAAALRARMTESHLATFRSEAKNRCAPTLKRRRPNQRHSCVRSSMVVMQIEESDNCDGGSATYHGLPFWHMSLEYSHRGPTPCSSVDLWCWNRTNIIHLGAARRSAPFMSC